jgi:polyphosphate glucokinase
MKVLVIDIGGTNVKMLAAGKEAPRKFPSGTELTPEKMVAGVLAATEDWDYNAISMGYPGPVMCGQPIAEPANLGRGWLGFDFEAAFHYPVKTVNDAAMQAVGSYEGGKMLFLGLGTGLGAAVVMAGSFEALEIGRFYYRKRTLEYYVGARGLKRQGRKKWQRDVEAIVEGLRAALRPDDVVIGGGNVKKLKPLPPHTRPGNNANAFLGGFRLWQGEGDRPQSFSVEPQSAFRANVS